MPSILKKEIKVEYKSIIKNMNIVPREPFEDLGGFFRDDDWFFPVFSQKKIFEPEMNVYETKDKIVAELNIPDIDCKDVKVFMDDGVLKVSGKFEEEEKEKDKNYWKKKSEKDLFREQ